MKRDMNRKRAHRKPQKGSALLVSLMVMVGLSLLGLGYVAVSETESAISVNERNSIQTREVAEAGVKTVIEWFQDPEWADDVEMLPPNIAQIKTDRRIAGASIGRYKPAGRLFDKPHKGANENRFFGNEAHADIWINNVTLSGATDAADKAYLNELNKLLLNGDYSAGRITEILVYAPPMSGATENADGFFEGGTRLGLATVVVTATKCRDDSDANPCSSDSDEDRIIARRTVRAVISEWPFPGPSGPVQTNANLGTNGDVKVHWGKITATGSMKLKRPFSAIPWHDAYNTVNFQYGFADTAAAEDPWPVVAGDFRTEEKWLHQIVKQTLEDPWYQARTRGDFTGDGIGGSPVAYRYDDPALSLYLTAGGTQIPRAIFQQQSKNETWDYLAVLFPKFDYDFWKDVAITADDQDNVFYLTWVADDIFKDKDGNQKAFEAWVNTAAGAKAGFYFFETKNKLNPQNAGAGQLTPGFSVKGNPFQAQGFLYSNSLQWDSAGGAKGVVGFYQMPGEPYKDIGYPQVKVDKSGWVVDGLGKFVPEPGKDKNGKWDYNDLDDDDVFDYVVAERTAPRPDGSGNVKFYYVVPWKGGCNPGVDCSEPHEPYLNLEHTTEVIGGVTVADNAAINVQWRAGRGLTLPKLTSDKTSAGSPVSCNTPPADEKTLQAQCTSNAYDKDGPLVQLDPGLNGVLYVEGMFEQTGNMLFFGSILAQGDFGKAGTPDVYFDERLIKEEWPPREFRFPRVFVSAMQSDQ